MKKTIRKSLALLLAVLMLMTVSPMGLATEGEPVDPPHTHTFTAVSAWLWDTSDYSSCAAKVVCSDPACGEIAHLTAAVDENTDAYQAPTCTVPGKRVIVAEVTLTDGTKVSDNHEIEIPKTGHNFKMSGEGSVAVSNNDNTHSYKCVNPECTAVGIMKEVTVDEVTTTVAEENGKEACSGGTATCTARTKCDVCGEDYGPDASHDLEKKDAVAWTCGHDGNIAYYKCKREDCGKMFAVKEDGTADLNKELTAAEIVDPAESDEHVKSDLWEPAGIDGAPYNCLQEGISVKKCTKCGFIMESKPLPAAASHSIDEDEWVYESSTGTTFVCADGGKRYHECTVCGARVGEETVNPSQQHEDEIVDAVEATCGKPGHNAYQKCKRCGRELGKVETDPKQHVWEVVEAKEPTCSETGNIAYYKCKNCGILSRAANEANIIEDIKDADGKVIETALEQVTRDKTDHKFESYVKEKDASCTLAGRKEVFKCKTCSQMAVYASLKDDGTTYEDGAYAIGDPGEEVYYKDITDLNEAKTEPIGHRWFDDTKPDSVGYVKPECNKEGQHIKYCLRCGQKETVVDPALEHVKDEPVRDAEGNPVTGPATCTDPAYELWTCANCREEFKVFSTAEPLGHPWGDSLVVVVEPSCTSKGAHGYKCDRCGATKDVVYDIDMIEHTWADDNKEATCTEDGYTRKVCSVCGAVKDEVVVKGEHVDKDPADGYCDRCGTYISCDHICHKTDAFSKIIWFIMNVWNQFLGINQTCKCGQLHYEKATNIVVPD